MNLFKVKNFIERNKTKIIVIVMVIFVLIGFMWATSPTNSMVVEARERHDNNIVDNRFEQTKGYNVDLILVKDKITGCSFIAKKGVHGGYTLLPNTCNK